MCNSHDAASFNVLRLPFSSRPCRLFETYAVERERWPWRALHNSKQGIGDMSEYTTLIESRQRALCDILWPVQPPGRRLFPQWSLAADEPRIAHQTLLCLASLSCPTFEVEVSGVKTCTLLCMSEDLGDGDGPPVMIGRSRFKMQVRKCRISSPNSTRLSNAQAAQTFYIRTILMYSITFPGAERDMVQIISERLVCRRTSAHHTLRIRKRELRSSRSLQVE